MNKAFCKEPDSSLPPRCPACAADGRSCVARVQRYDMNRRAASGG